jgi:hypothetical protein
LSFEGGCGILKAMKRWLWIIVVGAGVLWGSVVPPHFSNSPDRPTVTQEQPALPTHPEHGGDREITPGPSRIERPAHIASATSVNATLPDFLAYPANPTLPDFVVLKDRPTGQPESRDNAAGLMLVFILVCGAVGMLARYATECEVSVK